MPYTEENSIGNAKIARQTEISSELEMLHASVNMLGGVFESLSSRIEPILGQELPTESVNEKRTEAITKVGENIRMASDRVNNIRSAMERIIRRVEL